MDNGPLPLPLFIILIAALVLWPIGAKILFKFRKHDSDSLPHFLPADSPFKLLGWALRDLLTLRRLAVSLLLGTGIAFLRHIPLPGFTVPDLSYLGLDLENVYSMPSLFSLNLQPFLSACVYMQVVALFIPPLRRWMFDSTQFKKMAWATLLCTFTLVLILATSLAIGFEGRGWIEPGAKLMVIISLTAAMSFLLVIAKCIQSWGIGNGIAICYVALSVPGLLKAWQQTLILIPASAILFLIAFRLAYRTPCYTVINKTPLQLPLRRTLLGITPWHMTAFVVLLPATLNVLYPSEFLRTFTEVSAMGWPNMVFSLVILVACVFAYKNVVFRSGTVVRWLHQYGFEVRSDFKNGLSRALNRTLLLTTVFLFVAAHLPALLAGEGGISYNAASLLVSWPVIILGGVAADIVSQLQFYRDRATSGIENWVQLTVAGDDMEAAIIQGHLRSHEIPALIEPLRFSWRLPARTMVDQYVIYIPETHIQKAKEGKL